tara:strand:+ start:1086 stop:1310 length:225 start_codon:yes stop_codon:yes gene_type:complete
MNVSDYRTETTAKLVKLDERQVSIFKSLQRIEKHLEKLNGQTEKNSHAIIMFKTWGSAAIFVVPVIITIIMRLI